MEKITDQNVLELIKSVSSLTSRLDTWIEAHEKIHEINDLAWNKQQEFNKKTMVLYTGAVIIIGIINLTVAVLTVSKWTFS
jgi:hypothetical protein